MVPKHIGVLDKFLLLLPWPCQRTTFINIAVRSATPFTFVLAITFGTEIVSQPHIFEGRFLITVQKNGLRRVPAPLQVLAILAFVLIQFTIVAIPIVGPFTDFLWFFWQLMFLISLFQSAMLFLGFVVFRAGMAVVRLATRAARELFPKVQRNGTQRRVSEHDVTHSSDQQVALPDPVYRPP